jgi:hypothetical protein
LKILFLFFLVVMPLVLHSQEPMEPVEKTPRMAEIAAKYHMELAGILRTPLGEYFWCYMTQDISTRYDHFPVVVPPEATDAEVDVAIIAAKHCAQFYEANLQHEQQEEEEPTPAPTPTPTPAGWRKG